MVHPIYLTISEAAEHLADKTGKRVTADWLLEHGGAGALQVYFMLRRPVMLEEATIEEAPTFYSSGDRLPLPNDWAKWMLAVEGEKPSIEIQTLLLANGQPRWTLDCGTGKRMPVEIFKTDLYVRTAEIDQFVTGAAAPSGAPENPPPLDRFDGYRAADNDSGRDPDRFANYLAGKISQQHLSSLDAMGKRGEGFFSGPRGKLRGLCQDYSVSRVAVLAQYLDYLTQHEKDERLSMAEAGRFAELKLGIREAIDKAVGESATGGEDAMNSIKPLADLLYVKASGIPDDSALSGTPGHCGQTNSVTIHKIKTRSNILGAVIELAGSTATNPDDYQSVWAELVILAERTSPPAPLVGYSSDGIQYRGKFYEQNQVPDVFKKDALRKRMNKPAR